MHDKTWKSFDIMDVDKHKNNNLLSNLFNNKFIKNKILLGEKNNEKKEIHSNMKYSKTNLISISYWSSIEMIYLFHFFMTIYKINNFILHIII